MKSCRFFKNMLFRIFFINKMCSNDKITDMEYTSVEYYLKKFYKCLLHLNTNEIILSSNYLKCVETHISNCITILHSKISDAEDQQTKLEFYTKTLLTNLKYELKKSCHILKKFTQTSTFNTINPKLQKHVNVLLYNIQYIITNFDHITKYELTGSEAGCLLM